MRIKNLKKISISYNAIGKYTEPTEIKLARGSALVFPFTFCESHDPAKKCPAAIVVGDKNFQQIMRIVIDPNIETIDVFIGKKSSGALEIIRIFWDMLPSVRHKIHWYACQHDLEEKLVLLESLGVPRDSSQLFRITDNIHPCRDSIALLGSIYYELDVAT